MSDHINLLKNAESLTVASEFAPYTGVELYAGQDSNGNDIVYTAGTTNGNVLTVNNPLGTQAMANNILTAISGYRYQPIAATGAMISPAAEMGDSVTVNGVTGGIYVRATNFSRLMDAEIKAPCGEETAHEFGYTPAAEREWKHTTDSITSALRVTSSGLAAEVTRATAAEGTLSATLTAHASQIEAKVSATGGDSSATSWSLTSSAFTVKSKNKAVLSVTEDGATIEGVIKASSGNIGGFSIGARGIYNGISDFNYVTPEGETTKGVYIGTNGIRLGDNFTVTNGGNVTAKNCVLSGSMHVEKLYVRAQDGESWTAITSSQVRGGIRGGVSFSAKESTIDKVTDGYNGAKIDGTGEYPAHWTAGVIHAKTRIQLSGQNIITWSGVGQYIDYADLQNKPTMTKKTMTVGGAQVNYWGW